MSNKILFVFEGKKTEPKIMSNLQKHFNIANATIECIYDAEIYQIYKEIEGDEDLDTFGLLKERHPNKENLSKYKRSDFSEIYLFFDYEGHSSIACDKKLNELLSFFCEETEKGKLYISYPMVESIRHICNFETFHELAVECKEKIHYKNKVHETCLKEISDIRKYDKSIWTKIITAHIMKMNFIICGAYSIPERIYSQTEIFKHQEEKYIIPFSKVSVLNAFPIFLHDYYGNNWLKKLQPSILNT